MSLIISEVQKNINALSFEERVELSHWLKESVAIKKGDSEWDAEGVRVAELRIEDLKSGQAKELSMEEFWERVETDRYGDAEDTELDLAEKRDAELAIGAKKLVSEEEFWQKIQRFKATLE